MSDQFDVSYIETHGTAHSITTSGPHFTPPPTVIIAITVDIEHVLDLTVQATRDALGTDETELTRPWFEQMIAGNPVPTHILAHAAHSLDRFQAIKFPSALRAGTVNLMVWPKKLSHPYFIEVHDPSHRLYQRIPAPSTK